VYLVSIAALDMIPSEFAEELEFLNIPCQFDPSSLGMARVSGPCIGYGMPLAPYPLLAFLASEHAILCIGQIPAVWGGALRL
jgi:hypothetical protein